MIGRPYRYTRGRVIELWNPPPARMPWHQPSPPHRMTVLDDQGSTYITVTTWPEPDLDAPFAVDRALVHGVNGIRVELPDLPKPERPRQQSMRADRKLRAERALTAYVRDDMTLEQIGKVHGVTRECIRQEVMLLDPTLYRLAQRRRAARGRLRALVDYNPGGLVRPVVCALCGETFQATSHGNHRFCSSLHRQVNAVILYQIDEDRRRATLLNTARWQVKVGTASQWHHDTINGTAQPRQAVRNRWLVEGSLAFHWCCRAYVLGWPVFDRLDPQVQAQIREHVDGPE